MVASCLRHLFGFLDYGKNRTSSRAWKLLCDSLQMTTLGKLVVFMQIDSSPLSPRFRLQSDSFQVVLVVISLFSHDLFSLSIRHIFRIGPPSLDNARGMVAFIPFGPPLLTPSHSVQTTGSRCSKHWIERVIIQTFTDSSILFTQSHSSEILLLSISPKIRIFILPWKDRNFLLPVLLTICYGLRSWNLVILIKFLSYQNKDFFSRK